MRSLRPQKWNLKGAHVVSAVSVPYSSIFFPSCASVALARSSHIVVLMNELSICIINVPPCGVKSGVRTNTQSEVCQAKTDKTQNQNKATKTNTNKNRNKKNTKDSERTEKTALKGLAASAPMNSRSCTETNEKHRTTVHDLAKVFSKTNHSAAPKPRIPPARIPEIALRSPPGIKHLRNYMQPCNELASNTSVGTLPCKAPKELYGVKHKTR